MQKTRETKIFQIPSLGGLALCVLRFKGCIVCCETNKKPGNLVSNHCLSWLHLIQIFAVGQNLILMFALLSVSVWTINYSGNWSKLFKVRSFLSNLSAHGDFRCKILIHFHGLSAISEQRKSRFLHLTLTYRLTFILIERAIRKRYSGVAQLAPTNRNRLLQKQRDQECRMGSRSGFCWSQNCRGAQGRENRFLLLDAKSRTNLPSSFSSLKSVLRWCNGA